MCLPVSRSGFLLASHTSSLSTCKHVVLLLYDDRVLTGYAPWGKDKANFVPR